MLIDDADRPAKWYFGLKAPHLPGDRENVSKFRMFQGFQLLVMVGDPQNRILKP
jgi:hypothetical protein